MSTRYSTHIRTRYEEVIHVLMRDVLVGAIIHVHRVNRRLIDKPSCFRLNALSQRRSSRCSLL